MTREEEIKEARHEWYLRTQDADFCAGFQKGAEWADEHPMTYDGKAMLYVNNRSHENGYKEAVNKACEWLEEFMQMTPSKKTFIKRFEQAMKED